jgi:tripartite-type tricarboxylate transporter receptor subunit TctC
VKTTRRPFLLHTWASLGLAALAGLAVPAAVLAQEFPKAGIRIIVPTSTATASDFTARFIAEEMAREFGVGVVVENKSGANGILAVQQLLSLPADGHTMLLTASGLYANPALYRNVPYDPVRDWHIVAPVNETQFILVGAPNFAPRTVRELVDFAKSRPEEVTYASASVGSSTHLGPELFAARAGIRLRHIPYKGGAQAIADTAGGQVNIAMTAIPTAAPLVQSGKLRALAVTGTSRSPLMPDVPTLAEAGVVGAEITSKQALIVRPGTPEPIVARLRASITRITATPEYAKFLAQRGLDKEPIPLDEYLKSGPEQLRRWTEMVRLSGAKLD